MGRQHKHFKDEIHGLQSPAIAKYFIVSVSQLTERMSFFKYLGTRLYAIQKYAIELKQLEQFLTG